MSNLQKNAERSRELAEAEKKNSCAKTDLQMAEEKRGDLTDMVLQNAAFEDANKVFEQAKAAPPGPAKDALWRKAGEMYADALDAAPAHKDAPGGRDQLGLLLQAGRRVRQGDQELPEVHRQLRQRGHPQSPAERRGRSRRSKRRSARTRRSTRSASSTSGWRTTRCRRRTTASSPTSARPSRSARSRRTRGSTTRERANAARIAMVLYSNLGDRANMNKMYAVLVDPRMHLAADKRAEADYLKASFDYGQWNPAGGESAGNSARARPGDREPRAVPRGEQGHGPSRRATSSSRPTASPR